MSIQYLGSSTLAIEEANTCYYFCALNFLLLTYVSTKLGSLNLQITLYPITIYVVNSCIHRNTAGFPVDCREVILTPDAFPHSARLGSVGIQKLCPKDCIQQTFFLVLRP